MSVFSSVMIAAFGSVLLALKFALACATAFILSPVYKTIPPQTCPCANVFKVNLVTMPYECRGKVRSLARACMYGAGKTNKVIESALTFKGYMSMRQP